MAEATNSKLVERLTRLKTMRAVADILGMMVYEWFS